MASNIKAKFEEMGKPPPPTHERTEVEVVKDVRTGKYRHTGNTGGGHSGHDGKFTDVERQVVSKEVKTTFTNPPPAKKSFSDLP